MPKTTKAKKMAASLQMLILGLFHLSFLVTTYPVPEKTLLGRCESRMPLPGRSCKGIAWSLGDCRAACSGLLGCASIAVVVEAIASSFVKHLAKGLIEGEGQVVGPRHFPHLDPSDPHALSSQQQYCPFQGHGNLSHSESPSIFIGGVLGLNLTLACSISLIGIIQMAPAKKH